MKNLLSRLSTAAALLFCSTTLIQAQMPGGNSSPMNAAMLKLFGKQTNFTAKADVKMLDAAQKENMSMVFDMALLDGKMRVDMDMSKMKSAMLSSEMIAQMQKMGADKTVYIVRPDLKQSLIIYPTLKSYAQIPMSAEDQKALDKEPNVQITALGKETIDGHPCVKNKAVITDEKGKAQEATVWNATDLKDFAIQMQVKEKDANVLMKFKDVQFTKPDAKQFDAPTGFTKYNSMQELQQVMMRKMMESMRP